MKKKSILCYGDSNTFGYRPMDSQRYPYGIRWTSLLAENLGEDFRVIEAGLNSRTTAIDDDLEKDRNGWKCIDVVMWISPREREVLSGRSAASIRRYTQTGCRRFSWFLRC